MSVVLFGSGSPLIVDVEETCRRLNLPIVAIVKNREGADYAINAAVQISLDDTTPELFFHPVVIPLFTPANRKVALEDVRARGAGTFDPLIDPTAILPSTLDVGEGVYVNSGVTIGAVSRLGRFSLVNRSASLGHHVDLGEFVSIGPGACIAGQVTIGRGAMVGTGAVILPGVAIGENAVVAAGAVVTRDLPARVVAAGNPAEIVKSGIAGYGGQGI